jgi:hypothetical protein
VGEQVVGVNLQPERSNRVRRQQQCAISASGCSCATNERVTCAAVTPWNGSVHACGEMALRLLTHRLAMAGHGYQVNLPPTLARTTCCLNNAFRWTFSGQGECTSIPQLSHLDKAQQGAACSNGRARVAAYPTHVAHGLLWVWPEAGAWEAALAAVPDLDPSLGVISGSEYTDWFVRDVPLRCVPSLFCHHACAR